MLGRALRRLCPNAVFISSHECDLRDRGQVIRLFDRIRPTQIIHLAARLGGVKANAQWNVDLFESNLQINATVLSVARQCRIPRLIAVLSSCAFPLFDHRPSTESDLHAESPYAGNFGYAVAKRYLDLHVRLVAQEENLLWSSLTPVTMYGPHDNVDLDTGHVIGSLVHRCWLAKRDESELTVWGSGQAIRQFVYVDDIARLLLLTLDRDSTAETVIVAPDHGITIYSLAQSVARAMDYKGPIRFDTSQPEGVRVKRLQSGRFKQVFPGFSFTPFMEGLHATVDWFLSTQHQEERQGLASTGRFHAKREALE